MDDETVYNYLKSKPESTLDYPFDLTTAVFKVQNKMFALFYKKDDLYQINLKCDPQQAVMLRDIFSPVKPGYHMNKTHWNTVLLDGSLPQGEIERMIDHSYTLVVKGLKKSIRLGLEARHGQATLYR